MYLEGNRKPLIEVAGTGNPGEVVNNVISKYPEMLRLDFMDSRAIRIAFEQKTSLGGVAEALNAYLSKRYGKG